MCGFDYKELITDGIKLTYSICGKEIDLSRNYINKRGVLTVFSIEDYMKYKDLYSTINISNLSESEYTRFKEMDLEHTKYKLQSPIYYISDETFALKGKKSSDLRYAYNRYRKDDYKCIYQDQPNNIDELLNLFMVWKKQKKERNDNISILNYENLFLNTNPNLNKYIGKYFYINNELTAYAIVDHVKDNLFNLLYQKANLDYPMLSVFAGFITYKHIYDNITNGKDFYVNSGETGFSKDQLFYKKNTFEICDVLTVYHVKVINNNLVI